jgi:hypothetical protein
MNKGSSVDVFLSTQREWQVHYFDALDMKPSSGNDEFHDALAGAIC